MVLVQGLECTACIRGPVHARQHRALIVGQRIGPRNRPPHQNSVCRAQESQVFRLHGFENPAFFMNCDVVLGLRQRLEKGRFLFSERRQSLSIQSHRRIADQLVLACQGLQHLLRREDAPVILAEDCIGGPAQRNQVRDGPKQHNAQQGEGHTIARQHLPANSHPPSAPQKCRRFARNITAYSTRPQRNFTTFRDILHNSPRLPRPGHTRIMLAPDPIRTHCMGIPNKADA